VQPHGKACEDGGDDREPDHIQRRGDPRRRPVGASEAMRISRAMRKSGNVTLTAIKNANTI
jgi:hypothetical protein